MTARGIGWALFALVIGASAGVGGAYATRPEPHSSGKARPVLAASPSVPTDDPFAPDIKFRPLREVTEFDHYEIGGGPQLRAWEFPVPKGWVAYAVTHSGDRAIPPEEVGDYLEVRFRPEGEPLEGGYSLRVKAINNHAPSLDEVSDKIADFEELFEDVAVLEQSDSAVFFTFRTEEGDKLRYNLFHWFAVPGDTEATLEMSVAGRAVDEEGLRALVDEFADQAQPVED